MLHCELGQNRRAVRTDHEYALAHQSVPKMARPRPAGVRAHRRAVVNYRVGDRSYRLGGKLKSDANNYRLSKDTDGCQQT